MNIKLIAFFNLHICQHKINLIVVTITCKYLYILFNKNFGMLSNKLIYDYNMSFEVKEMVLNLLADIAIIAVVIFVAFKLRKFLRPLMTTVLLAVIFLSAMSKRPSDQKRTKRRRYHDG